MARLIRTEKEVEGRYTEQWVVVEGDDDALDQWPQGPREVVGRPAPGRTGTSGRAARRSTPATCSSRDCSTRRCCARLTRARA